MIDLKIEKIDNRYDEFLRDESRKTGSACTISFPVSEDEVSEALSFMAQSHTSVTIQGARTGLAAGAVPFDGHILNLGRMDRVAGMSFDKESGCFLLTVQPGVVLSQLREMLAKKYFNTAGWSDNSLKVLELFKESGDWFFPPDPTEASASIGGMTACNSSGACSFLYGPTRKYIKTLDIVLADGSKLKLRRGRDKASAGEFVITNSKGRMIRGNVPAYELPEVKNASGYYSSYGMDLVDLFIGSEGTLGVVTGIELQLIPLPAHIWGMMAFFTSEADALRFVRELRGGRNSGTSDSEGFKPAALEYFNNDALKLLRKMKSENPAFSEIQNIPAEHNTAIYTEYHGDSEDAVCNMVMQATELLETSGGNGDATWLAANFREMERLHIFRHAVPEAVNLTIDMRRKADAGLTKLGTDMAVPDERLEDVMEMYNGDLVQSGLESVIFGHIGNNHVHVNILPRSMQEYETGRKLYREWARRVIDMGGTVSAEHGVGKLKTALLKEMYGNEGIKQMQAVKQVFDPNGILCPGNLFEI